VSEKIACGSCGTLLYFGEEIKRRLYMCAIPSEEEVLAAYKNTCPKCGNALSMGTVKVDITRRVRYGS